MNYSAISALLLSNSLFVFNLCGDGADGRLLHVQKKTAASRGLKQSKFTVDECDVQIIAWKTGIDDEHRVDRIFYVPSCGCRA